MFFPVLVSHTRIHCTVVSFNPHFKTSQSNRCHPFSALSMSTNTDTVEQTSLELPETSHGFKKESDNVVSSTDATFSTDATLKNVMVNRRPSSSVVGVATSNDSSAETKVRTPASVKAEKKNWRKTVFLNMQDDKKDDVVDPLTFPNSKKYNSCCSSCLRFGCHSLVDVDDLILRQEREQLLLHMQEEEEILSLCDKRLEYVVECSLGFCCKKPKSCFSYGETCLKHTATIWGYRVWQVAIMILLFVSWVRPSVGYMFCDDSTIFGHGNPGQFRCDAIQELLRTSNYTKDSDGYAGMTNTMKALSYSSCDYSINGTSQSIWNAHHYLQHENLKKPKYGPYKNLSLPISELDCISINGTFAYDEEDFLQWHAITRSIIPRLVRILRQVIIWVLLPGSLFLVFGMQFQKDDPTEIMFPSLLEEKYMDQSEGAEELEPDMEIGNRNMYSQKFHFIRPKKFVLRSSLWLVSFLFLFGWLSMYGFSLNLLYVWDLGRSPFFVALVTAICLGPVLTIVLIGLFVQIHNATTL